MIATENRIKTSHPVDEGLMDYAEAARYLLHHATAHPGAVGEKVPGSDQGGKTRAFQPRRP
jgi:hypothetical protein